MREILLIGPVGCGKTTLKKLLLGQDTKYAKTQVIDFSSRIIDCPGEYLEIPRYYHVIIDLSHRASEIWALQDATRKRSYYPPNFTKSFNKPVIGIITKLDLPDSDRQRADELLRYAGVEGNFYHISSKTGEGCDELKDRFKNIDGGK